jgi:hypothetical protein
VAQATALFLYGAFGRGGHICLVPEQGAEQVTALHEQLYGGALKWAHRADIPYVPLIAVAAYARHEAW